MVIRPPCFNRSFFCMTVLSILGLQPVARSRIMHSIFTDIAQELMDRGHTVTCVPIFKAWAKILQ